MLKRAHFARVVHNAETVQRAFDCAAAQLSHNAAQRRGQTRVAPFQCCAQRARTHATRALRLGTRARRAFAHAMRNAATAQRAFDCTAAQPLQQTAQQRTQTW
eukprot:10301659-Lingulodinium_polyedra.AAC.1